MGQINYSFDPNKPKELKDLFEFLHKINPEIPEDYSDNDKHNSFIVSERDKTIREKEEIIKRHEKENEKNQKALQDLRTKLKEANDMLTDSKEEADNKEKQIAILEKECDEKVTKLQTELTNEVNRIKEEKEKEISSLKKQIDDYAKKIAIYEPTLNGDTGSDKFFDIEGPNLGETLSDDAPFIGRVDVGGNACFNFNVDKGPHKKFAQDCSLLENYCNITEKIEGANHICLGEWGKGKFNRGTLVVTKKANIKLVRE